MTVRAAAVVAAVLAALGAAAPASAADGGGEGESLFKQYCSACHTLGGGDTAGPDLQGVVERSGEERTRAIIADPAGVIASGDPEVDALVKKFNGVQMPDVGLTDPQVDAVVEYLKKDAGAGGEVPATSTAPTPAAAGDADDGKRLFTGETQLENGGPSCISCHAIAGAGALGGGQIGPDLTEAYSRYGGAQGVPAMLASLPFPSMQPVYEGHALTEREQADLAAFLARTNDQAVPDDRTWALVLIGVGVAVALVLLAFLIWPRRSVSVRRRIAPTSNLTRRR